MHQDQAYHDPAMAYKGVNFWMPLDDATVESGCLQFIPGSHKLDVLPHHSINRDPRIHGLEVDDPEKYAERQFPVLLRLVGLRFTRVICFTTQSQIAQMFRGGLIRLRSGRHPRRAISPLTHIGNKINRQRGKQGRMRIEKNK